MGATFESPEATTTPASPRKVRCRVLVDRKGSLDRCGGEELFDGCGWCGRHLAEAAEIFRRITEGLIRPGDDG